MGVPQRDKDGNPRPYDDADIKDNHHLIREVSHHVVVFDENRNCWRVSSAVFSPSSKPKGNYRGVPLVGMSADWEEPMLESDVNIQARVSNQLNGLIRIGVGGLRSLGNIVGADPIDPSQPYHANLSANPYHVQVWGKCLRERLLNKVDCWEWVRKADKIA